MAQFGYEGGNMKKMLFIGIILLLLAGFAWAARTAISTVPDNTHVTAPAVPGNTTGIPLAIPDGFSVSLFAKNLNGARVLAWDPLGTMLVSVPDDGKVLALPDMNTDGVAEEPIVVMSGLNRLHGLAFHTDKLYIAETDGIAVYDYDTKTKKASNKKKIIDLPGGGNHFSRTIGFGPDGRLYITVGSSCNVCVEKDDRRAKMLVANVDGSGLREYAKGLRNSVFFVWHPVTKQLWATDMGRDLLGDNIPPEEVNIIEEGGDYGWPYCYDNRVHDNAFDPKNTKRCDITKPPRITFQAHSAPLGLAFIPDSWPKDYRGDLLVSYHGSWNRTEPTGYKVVRFYLDAQGNSTKEEDIISGWLTSRGALGRPVDLLFDTQGRLYVSDDKAGVIYVVTPPTP